MDCPFAEIEAKIDSSQELMLLSYQGRSTRTGGEADVLVMGAALE